MEYLVTAEEMKSYDHAAIHRIKIPSLVLMERAALSVYEEIRKRFPDEKGRRVLILAGCGNNGADGLALARMLSEAGFFTEVVICGNQEKATLEWKTQYEILSHFPVRTGSKPQLSEYDIFIDALFGVGLSREVTGDYAQLISWFNEAAGFKLAVDVPSGIHSDNGRVMGCAVKADLTVCFAYGKRGLYLYPGCEYAGEVVLKQIGIGETAFFGRKPGMFRYTENIKELLPARDGSGNKGTFGKVLLAAGSRNMAGAAVLAALGCYRSGAGMVKVLTPECNRAILQTAVPEALLCTERVIQKELFDWPDVLVIGPGLGTDERAYGLLHAFLTDGMKPMGTKEPMGTREPMDTRESMDALLPIVIDADGLNLLAMHPELMALVEAQDRTIILTPHVGELARLCGKTAAQVKEFLPDYAMGLAQKLNCVIVSKDARTFVCQSGRPICLNIVGNSGMATAGSGDVLAGVIAGLLAQGMNGFEAAGVGVYLHALAGDAAAARLGQHGLMAGDIAAAVAEVLSQSRLPVIG